MNQLSRNNLGGQNSGSQGSVNNYNGFQPYRRPCSSTFQFLIFVTIVAIFLGGIITVLVLLCPHSPKFQISSVSIFPFYIRDSNLTAVWTITFHVKNPSRGSLSYEDVKVSVYYKTMQTNTLLSSANQSCFDQPQKSLTKYEVIISASSLSIANGSVNAIIEDWLRGIVPFDFQMQAKSVYVPVPLISWKHQITVNCNNVKIEVGPSHSFNVIVGRFRRCQVS